MKWKNHYEDVCYWDIVLDVCKIKHARFANIKTDWTKVTFIRLAIIVWDDSFMKTQFIL